MSGTGGDPVQVPGISVASPVHRPDPVAGDDVSIIILSGDQPTQVSGWQTVVIRRGIEIVPASFELEATEFAPTALTELTIEAGQICQIRIGNQLVITGYVDAVVRSVTATSHSVRVVGRSKSEDLVDCSAEFSTYQIRNTTALALAQQIAQPFGITVKAIGDIGSVQIPQFDVILTETGYEIIERVCRYAALLAYDSPLGGLLLARVGSTMAASGFTEGVNVESASYTESMAERFSEIHAILQTTDTALNTPGESDLTGSLENETIASATDAGVPRYRPLLFPAEQGDALITANGTLDTYGVTKQRVQWEVNRRAGRARPIQLVCDSWRDSALALWTPNTLAPVHLPSLKVAPSDPLLIAEVTFRRDEDGTHAEIVLMPPAAFAPEPIVLQPIAPGITQALAEGGASAGPSAP